MKKLISLLLVSLLILSLCACDTSTSSGTGNKPANADSLPEKPADFP